MTEYVSIKNNCRTPYCTKLITDWTPYPNDLIKTLAYVTISRKFFDPIIDPDLVDDYFRPQQDEFIDSPSDF